MTFDFPIDSSAEERRDELGEILLAELPNQDRYGALRVELAQDHLGHARLSLQGALLQKPQERTVYGDEEATFIPLSPGRYRLSARAACCTQSREIEIRSGELLRLQPLPHLQQETGEFSGRLTDVSGRPLPDMEIWMVEKKGRSWETKTSASGTFQFSNLAPDVEEAEIAVTIPNRLFFQERYAVKIGREFAHLQLPPVRPLAVRVRDESGNPIVGAEMEGVSGPDGRPLKTDSSGEVTVLAPADGERMISFTISAAGYLVAFHNSYEFPDPPPRDDLGKELSMNPTLILALLSALVLMAPLPQESFSDAAERFLKDPGVAKDLWFRVISDRDKDRDRSMGHIRLSTKTEDADGGTVIIFEDEAEIRGNNTPDDSLSIRSSLRFESEPFALVALRASMEMRNGSGEGERFEADLVRDGDRWERKAYPGDEMFSLYQDYLVPALVWARLARAGGPLPPALKTSDFASGLPSVGATELSPTSGSDTFSITTPFWKKRAAESAFRVTVSPEKGIAAVLFPGDARIEACTREEALGSVKKED